MMGERVKKSEMSVFWALVIDMVTSEVTSTDAGMCIGFMKGAGLSDAN